MTKNHPLMASTEFLNYLNLESLPRGFWKKNNRLNRENIVKWIKWFETTHNIVDINDWYKITGEQINRAGGSGFFSTKAENPLKESMYELMKLVYPEHEWIPWNFTQAPQGYWKIKENRLTWCEAFRKQHEIKDLDDFYKYQLSDWEQFPGRCVGFYGDSIVNMLKELYPEHQWREWRFKGQVPKHFWTHKENIKRWFTLEIAEKFGWSQMEDMYQLTQPIITDNYGNGLSAHIINGSPIQLLQMLYPEHDWLFWKFVSAPNNAWSTIENQRKYLQASLDNKPVETLYNYSVRGDLPHGLTLKYKSLYELAKACFPETKWDENKFHCYKTEAKMYSYLSGKLPHIVKQFCPDWCINPMTKRNLRFDFADEVSKTIFEIDGQQHFKQVSNWSAPEKSLKRDIYKMQKAKQAGYKIIRIFQEDIYNNDEKWLDEHILPEIISQDRNPMFISTVDSMYDEHIKLIETENEIQLSDEEEEAAV